MTISDNGTASERPVVILLGGAGRLAPEVATALKLQGFDVLRVARRSDPGMEVSGIDTRHPRWWSPAPWAPLIAGKNVAAVINLVAGRDRHPHQAVSVGVGAIRTMVAIRGAALAQGSRLSTVHVGSVAEAQPGRRSAYALAKRSARAEALRLGVSVVVTLAVVPRASGEAADRIIRIASSLAPTLAAVPIAVSRAREAGEAVASLVTALRRRPGEHRGTVQLVLAAQLRPLGEVVGAAPRRRWYSHGIVAGAARLPATGLTQLDRLAALARLSLPAPAAPSHYLAGIPDDDTAAAHGTLEGLRLGCRRRTDSLGSLWLLPHPADSATESGRG